MIKRATKKALALLAAVTFVMLAVQDSRAAAADEWHFGIGTGLFAMNIDGDVGFHTASGPVTVSGELDNSEISDLMESAFGLGGFASKGKWKILYSAANLVLEGSGEGETPGGTPVAATLALDVTAAEASGIYNFAKTGKHHWGAQFGVRYLKHEYDFDLAIGSTPFSRDLDQDWTDAIVGIAHVYPFADKFAWSNLLNAGFGESEGTVFFRTSIEWHFAKSWNLSLYAQNTAQDFENEDPGHPDWYLYDVDEFGPGLGIAYLW